MATEKHDITSAFYTYAPLDWQAANGYKVDMKRCRASIYQDHRAMASQCSFKPRVVVEGHGFCYRHFNKLPKDLQKKGKEL